MKNKSDNCSRKKLFSKELMHDWDELNMAFKSLIIVGLILFIVVVIIAIFSSGGKGAKNSIEVIFRTTLASVFGFLLSSNIKNNTKDKAIELQKIQNELKELDRLNEPSQFECELEKKYMVNDINLVQIIIALVICLISILVICFLLITNNLHNMTAISQIRDLMCSSIGFMIGESSKK